MPPLSDDLPRMLGSAASNDDGEAAVAAHNGEDRTSRSMPNTSTRHSCSAFARTRSKAGEELH